MSKNKIPTAKNNLHSMNITEMALANVPAVPSADFKIFKSLDVPDGKEQVEKVIHFNKNVEKKQVFGYVLVPDESDYQGDICSKEEVEKAAHSFLQNAFSGTVKKDGVSVNHIDFSKWGYPVQSAIDIDGSIAKSYGLPDEQCKPGGWWLGSQITNDETWGKIDKGELTGYSIGGSGMRDPLGTAQKSILNKVLDTLNGVKELILKADENTPLTFSDAYKDKIDDEKLWDIQSAIMQSIRSIIESDAVNKTELLSASIDEFKSTVIGFVTAQKSLDLEGIDELEKIFKSGSKEIINKSTQGGHGMSDKKLEEILNKLSGVEKTLESLKDVPERLKAVEELTKNLKGDGEPNPDDKDKKLTKGKEDDGEPADPVMKELAKITKRLDKIEKTPEATNGDGPDGEKNKVTKRFDPDPDGERKTEIGKGLLGFPRKEE